jgi:hypothetical protein
MFGYRGSSVIAAFAQQGSAEFERLRDTLDEQNAAMRMAQEQMKGLQVAIKNLSDKFGVLAKTLGEGGLTEVFRGTVDLLRKFLDLMIKVGGNPTAKFILNATLLSAALLAAATVLHSLFLLPIVAKFGLFAKSTIVWAASMLSLASGMGGATVATVTFTGALGALRVAAIGFITTLPGAIFTGLAVIKSLY